MDKEWKMSVKKTPGSLRLPQVNVVFDRRKVATLDRKGSLELRITYNYKQKWLSTGIRLYANQWRSGSIVNCPELVQYSKILNELLTKVRQSLLQMLEEGQVDIHSISHRLQKQEEGQPSFIEFCNQRAEIRKYNRKKDTQERYNRFLRLFVSWGKILYFEDITEANIIAYDKYLSAQGMKDYSKWQNYHRFLNSFILDAIDAGFMSRNPYRWIYINKEKSDGGIDKYLTLEEFRRIKQAKMPTESLEKVRDLFIFQTYTCLRYSDLALFDASLIKTLNNRRVYIRPAKKTGKPFTVPILPAAWEILEKYHGHLPIISNVKYNLYLKSVGQAAGIDRALSTHWARHTGATLLLNEGVDTKIIKKICGHSSIKITEQIYAKLLDETVVDAVQDIDI